MNNKFETSIDNKTWTRNGFYISTNKAFLNLDFIYNFLARESYWAKGVKEEIVRKSIVNTAFCFGIYNGDPGDSKTEQVGFGRVISDLATIAYMADVFVAEPYRGLGLSKWLMSTIIDTEELKQVRVFLLGTRDAHSLYARYGFDHIDDPRNFMKIKRAYPEQDQD